MLYQAAKLTALTIDLLCKPKPMKISLILPPRVTT